MNTSSTSLPLFKQCSYCGFCQVDTYCKTPLTKKTCQYLHHCVLRLLLTFKILLS